MSGAATGLKVDHSSLDRVRDFFILSSGTIEGCSFPLGNTHDNLLTALGEFGETVRPGAEEFLVAWHNVFRIEHTATVVIANNIGAFNAECAATDLQYGKYCIT